MKVELITPPAKEPLTLTYVKDHLRIDLTSDEQDSLIQDYIIGARKYTEALLGRRLITQTWKYYMDDWPNADWFRIPFPPLVSVTSVKYKDEDESESTFSSGDYLVDTVTEPGRVVLKYAEIWPSETLSPRNPIYTEYVCGYGDSPADVPMEIRQALAMLVGHWYEQREAYADSAFAMRLIPDAYHAVLEQYRMSRFGL